MNISTIDFSFVSKEKSIEEKLPEPPRIKRKKLARHFFDRDPTVWEYIESIKQNMYSTTIYNTTIYKYY